MEEEKLRGTPAQERERLLQQVKDDNAEISTMERQITEMQEKVSRASYMHAGLNKRLIPRMRDPASDCGSFLPFPIGSPWFARFWHFCL